MKTVSLVEQGPCSFAVDGSSEKEPALPWVPEASVDSASSLD